MIYVKLFYLTNNVDDLVKSLEMRFSVIPAKAGIQSFQIINCLERWSRKKPQMPGTQKLRSEVHLQVRRNDDVAAQRRRWTFYETIKNDYGEEGKAD
jgi:hypothetical protein